MPLHRIKKKESWLVDDVSATAELGAPLPRYQFPKHEAPAGPIYSALSTISRPTRSRNP
jgi:hypothetical protein